MRSQSVAKYVICAAVLALSLWPGPRPPLCQPVAPQQGLVVPQGASPSDTGYRLYEDVRQYGAKGDGKTDDTEAIQKAVKAASTGSKVVLIPPGNYLTSGPGVKISESGVSFLGVGEYASVLIHTGEGPAITVGDGSQICQDNRIGNLRITSRSAKSDGIRLSDFAIRYNIEYVRINGFTAGAGIKAVDHNHSGHISRVHVEDNATGISLGDHGQFTDISYSKIFHNKKYGIELTDCNAINIISTQVEKNGGSDGASVIARGVDTLNLIGCYNEQDETYPAPFLILTKGVSSAYCRAVNLVGCRAIGNKKTPHAIVLESAQNVNFNGNMMKSFSNGIFVLRPLRANMVGNVSGQGNVFEDGLGADPFSQKQ